FINYLLKLFYINYISSLTTVEIFLNFSSFEQINQQEDENFIQILIPKLFQKNSNHNQNQNEIFIKENSTIPLIILELFTSSSSSSTLEMKTSFDKNYFFLKTNR
ncbi:unnamed protein product, partial [Rotaria sp. Silwood2]